MFENTATQKTESGREPDNIIKLRCDNTTFTIKEFMVGKEPIADIVARRVMRDLEPNLSTK